MEKKLDGFLVVGQNLKEAITNGWNWIPFEMLARLWNLVSGSKLCQTSKPQSHIWGFSYKVDFLNVGYSRTAEKHSVLVITNPLNSCTLSYKAVSACTRPAQDQAKFQHEQMDWCSWDPSWGAFGN